MPNAVNIMTWEVTLDPGYVAPSFPPDIATIRANTAMSRSEFCNAMHAAGLISFADALSAAKGEWPAPFAAALAALPTEMQERAQITWAAVQTIERTNPMILAVQAALGWSDAQADVLFGIA